MFEPTKKARELVRDPLCREEKAIRSLTDIMSGDRLVVLGDGIFYEVWVYFFSRKESGLEVTQGNVGKAGYTANWFSEYNRIMSAFEISKVQVEQGRVYRV